MYSLCHREYAFSVLAFLVALACRVVEATDCCSQYRAWSSGDNAAISSAVNAISWYIYRGTPCTFLALRGMMDRLKWHSDVY
ncbi:hypothetical protein DFS34DRAFT_637660 [Phlyctochytrium arcticum]|nr:hypothetical protein DFS34DRAFT_640502 [Phlyctochytrium arcticum]KAI9090266.1 hypothetical protein DFS34DRAFT_637660 [Phlyctochytrium arcticum]